MHGQIDLSIIIEWENVLLSGEERCLMMIRKLGNQLAEVGRSAELLILFDPDRVDTSDFEIIVRKNLYLKSPDLLLDVQFEELHDCHYFQFKNEGAKRARGDILIFIDSDVLPEENWLKEISQPFYNHPEIQVLAGNTYLSKNTLYEKAFYIGWFFTPRESDNILHKERQRFYANNVAFRHEIFLQHPFPDMPSGVTRGACAHLAPMLVESGITIWTNTAARVEHPPPAGLKHYIVRAFATGRDKVFYMSGPDSSLVTRYGLTLVFIGYRVLLMGYRLMRKKYRSGLIIVNAPLAFTIILNFYFLVFIGATVSLIFPKYARNHWVI